MTTSNLILSDRVQSIDQPRILDVGYKPEVRYYRLESYYLLPNLNEAICKVRNLLTGALRQVLASRLELVSYHDDSYLLEFVKTSYNSEIGVQQ
jgi:hypothetical protein